MAFQAQSSSWFALQPTQFPNETELGRGHVTLVKTVQLMNCGVAAESRLPGSDSAPNIISHYRFIPTLGGRSDVFPTLSLMKMGLTVYQACGFGYQDHFLPQGVLQISRCRPVGFNRG